MPWLIWQDSSACPIWKNRFTREAEELKEDIEKARDTPFRLTYADQGYLYMARGYGEKEKTGYSVEVNACYETSDAIRIQTTLLGPAKGEKTKEKKTYPYVVMKTEYREKDVIFE